MSMEFAKVECPGCHREINVQYLPEFSTPIDPLYKTLQKVLIDAFEQASEGKGKERHASDGEAFKDQPICEIARRLGGGALYQAVKKIYESGRLPGEAGIRELLGAINYIAAEIIVRREGKG